MCGITGMYNLDGSKVDIAQLKAMTDSIAHRGPDGDGIWANENQTIGFGHRRLSIIDLSANGNQPMHYLNRYSITYNGEIYNYLEIKKELQKKGYRFDSDSDTEVLLALYDFKKEKCLDDLDGMFAFAIWDEKEKELFCARDRFGEKPFFFNFLNDKQFVFGSEMKTLFSFGIKKEIDNGMLVNYLVYSDVTNPFHPEKTFYKNITRLSPAHYIKIKNKNIIIKKYWDINIDNVRTKLKEEEEFEYFHKLLSDSVSLRLRSDVSVGSCLSGGLDSSIVVSIINEIYNSNGALQKPKTFSVIFPGFELNEEKYVKIVEGEKNIEAYFTTPSIDFFKENLSKIFYHQEEPFPSSSIVAQYSVMELAKNNNTIVLLDGQGADEILGGYHWYYRIFLQETLKKSYFDFRKELKNGKSNTPSDFKFYLNTYFPHLYENISQKRYNKVVQSGNYENLISFFSKSFPNVNAIDKDFFMSYKDEIVYKEPYPPSLNKVLYADAMQNWLQSLLRYADRNSMAFSREVRLPFLSHKLVEYIFSLPSDYKIRNGWSKYILRKSFEKNLPKEIIWRTDKIGFASPQQEWEDQIDKNVLFENNNVKNIFNKSNAIKTSSTWKMLMVENLFKNQ